MYITLFVLLFIAGMILFYVSTKTNEYDISNTYQVMTSFLSVVVWAVLILASYNIEMYYIIADVLTTQSFIDYGFMGVSWAMMILSFLNTLVLLFAGSFNALFKVIPKE